MFKFTIAIFAVIIACVAAKPGLIAAPLAYSAPLVAAAAPAGVVTATSSQVISRNYNGVASSPIFAAPLAVAPAAYTAPVIAKYAAPATYAAPALSYAAYSAPLTYASPLKYTAASPILL